MFITSQFDSPAANVLCVQVRCIHMKPTATTQLSGKKKSCRGLFYADVQLCLDSMHDNHVHRSCTLYRLPALPVEGWFDNVPSTLHQWLAAQLVAIPRINIHLLILTLIPGVELHQTFELCVSGSDLWYAGISQRMNVSGSVSAHYIWEWYFGQTFHREPGGAPVGEGADWNLVWNFRN